MNAATDTYDLRLHPPRRWNVEVDGVLWLPRLIDKARAFAAGTLGMYLYGQSPIDDAVFKTAGVTCAEFLSIVRDQPDDRSVLAAVEARAPGAGDRLRALSRRPPAVLRLMIPILDVDEGYTRGPLAKPAGVLAACASVPIVAVLRRCFPFEPSAQ
jgi:hypothetical protein